MELQLHTVGLGFIALALVHVIFPRYFDWAADLKPLSLINRQMMYVHTLFIDLTVMLMGTLCLTSASDLINTRLGQNISLGFGIFWLVRLVIQFFGYSSELWRGKRFETFIHVLFIVLWAYVSALFFVVYWQGRHVQ